jgi:hypothetical protein
MLDGRHAQKPVISRFFRPGSGQAGRVALIASARAVGAVLRCSEAGSDTSVPSKGRGRPRS